MLRLARDLRDDYGLAVVISEHRLERVIQTVDRRVYLAGDGAVQELEPREAASQLPGAPPVSRIGQALGWSPLPDVTLRKLAVTSRPLRRSLSSAREAESPGAMIASMTGVEVQLGGRTVLKLDRARLCTKARRSA